MKKRYYAYLAIYFIVIAVYYYVALPPINWHAPEFWVFASVMILPLIVLYLIRYYAKKGIVSLQGVFEIFKPKEVVDVTKQGKTEKNIMIAAWVVGAFLLTFPTVSAFMTSEVFHAKSYANRISVSETDFSAIPEADMKKIPIIDRESSERLGDKVMGDMSEWVSQFEVSDEYTQISYKDSVYRVTPLTYNGIIKYFTNRDEGIPAYISVDSTNGKTKLVKLKDLGLGGLRYVPSAIFNENLMRHLRFNYPTVIFGSPSFEVDETGHPYYICTTYTYAGVGTKKQVTGAIFLDPISGESTRYALDEIPSWADRIYPEYLVVEELDQNGSFQKGFLNSIFGQSGVTITSEGYNYLEKDGDIWLYSGITSVNSDASNLGFVLVNLRTHEAIKINSSGANEYSAMDSAEAEVKNYGYQSTFPILSNVAGNPVYVMSLKDNGLIKMYATVNAIDYQQVAVVSSDEGLPALFKKTVQIMGQSEEGVNADTLSEATITIEEIEKNNIEGTTLYYLKADNEVYKITFNLKYENELVFLEKGDTLKIRYLDSEGIKTIKEIITE